MAEKEYIEREEALKICMSHYLNCLMMNDFNGDSIADKIKTEIQDLPKADVAPVKRGHWIFIHPSKELIDWEKCSECGYKNFNFSKFNFCPNCGAKMYEEKEND